MKDSNESGSKYLYIGIIILLVNIICAIISFFVILINGNLLWAFISALIYAISTFICVVPFFALFELFERVEKVELKTFGYSNSVAAIKYRDKKAREELRNKNYKLNLLSDDKLFDDTKAYKYDKNPKTILSDGRWVCSCGCIRQSYTDRCDCGEEKPKNT